MKEADIAFIRETVFNLINFRYTGTVSVQRGSHLCVEGTKECALITYSDKAELARGFFLLAKELSTGREYVSISQKRRFETLGVMPPLHTNTLTTDSLMRYIEYAAAVGMNSILLYIEDCYELEGYPYFGYLSGRYTRKELKDLDAYAMRLGVEIIPCIQTLAHLTTYMRWEESAPVQETAHSLFVGAEATYEFIEAMLKTMKECFHSDKIHLGMDEARELGLGKYLFEHEYKSKSALFSLHLERVKEICAKYGMKPIIWSDMIFKSCGGYDDEYSKRAVITDEVKSAIQDVGLMYWDYYKDNKDAYVDIIKRHRQLSDDVLFAGGIWNWDGYLPNFDYTMKTMKPAMEACLDMGIDTVFATVWDDPRDTFLEHSVYDFAIFSEYCYLGCDCTQDDIHSVGEYLTGYKREMTSVISEFFLDYEGATSMGARFIHCDLFYESMRYPINYGDAAQKYTEAAEKLERFKGVELADYAIPAFKAAALKAKIMELLRPAYNNHNTEELKEICEKLFPACIEAVSEIGAWQESLWLKYQKPYGMETIQMRFAGLVKRLLYQKERIESYLKGKIKNIDELDGIVMNDEHATWLSWEGNALPRKR